MKKLLMSMLLVTGLVGCGQGKKARQFEDVLEAHYGNQFTLVKKISNVNGYSVYKNESTGEYVAYNVGRYDEGAHPNYQAFIDSGSANTRVGDLFREDIWETQITYVDEFVGYDYEWDPYAYDYETDTYGAFIEVEIYESVPYYDDVLRTYYTDGIYTFNLNGNSSKDLETIAGIAEKEDLNSMSVFFSEKYGLSAGRAKEVAQVVASWQKISKERGITDTDKSEFSTEVLGTDLKTFEDALAASKQGEGLDEYKELVEKASELNNISPEHFLEIMGDMIQ